MNALLILFPTLSIVLLSFAAMAFLGVWTYRDAKARGLNAVLWLLVVLLVPSMIGLIIYLAVGRSQSVALCANCGAGLSADDQFCRKCGAAKTDGEAGPRPLPKGGNRGPLIGFFVCLGVTLLMVMALIASASLAPLLLYRNSPHVEIVQQDTVPAPIQGEAERILDGLESQNVSVGVIESNMGNQWNIRFALLGGQRSKEFTFTQGQQLHIDCTFAEGTVVVDLADADGNIHAYEMNREHQEVIGLEDLTPGPLTVTIIGNGATDGNISIKLQ